LKTFAVETRSMMVNHFWMGTGVAILAKFLPKFFRESEIVKLTKQGKREDANKMGMFMTGLVSLLMVMAAPLFGAKKLSEWGRPLLDILMQIPCATWFMEMIYGLYTGEKDFEDIAETRADIKKSVEERTREYAQCEATYKENHEDGRKPQQFAYGPGTHYVANGIVAINRYDSDTKTMKTLLVENLTQDFMGDPPMMPVHWKAFNQDLHFENSEKAFAHLEKVVLRHKKAMEKCNIDDKFKDMLYKNAKNKIPEKGEAFTTKIKVEQQPFVSGGKTEGEEQIPPLDDKTEKYSTMDFTGKANEVIYTVSQETRDNRTVHNTFQEAYEQIAQETFEEIEGKEKIDFTEHKCEGNCRHTTRRNPGMAAEPEEEVVIQKQGYKKQIEINEKGEVIETTTDDNGEVTFVTWKDLPTYKMVGVQEDVSVYQKVNPSNKGSWFEEGKKTFWKYVNDEEDYDIKDAERACNPEVRDATDDSWTGSPYYFVSTAWTWARGTELWKRAAMIGMQKSKSAHPKERQQAAEEAMNEFMNEKADEKNDLWETWGPFVKQLGTIVLAYAATRAVIETGKYAYNHYNCDEDEEEQEQETIFTQGKSKTSQNNRGNSDKGRNRSKGVGKPNVMRKAQPNKQFNPHDISPGAEDADKGKGNIYKDNLVYRGNRKEAEQAADRFDDYVRDEDRETYTYNNEDREERHREEYASMRSGPKKTFKSPKIKVKGHAKFWNLNEAKQAIPDVKKIAEVQKKIKNSKREYTISTNDYLNWLKMERKKKDQSVSEMGKIYIEKQAFSPQDIMAGIYKIYNDKDQYLCTGTLVANRMFVVLHCLDSNDLTRDYKARNHVNSIVMKGETLIAHNNEIGSFRVSTVKTPFNIRTMRVLENSEMVSVFGYGEGIKTSPDLIMGFASPLGWCTAPTRVGDCTSPVLDVNGKIVGFWTHGDGQKYGKFEPVTQGMIDDLKTESGTSLDAMDFRSSLLSQKL